MHNSYSIFVLLRLDLIIFLGIKYITSFLSFYLFFVLFYICSTFSIYGLLLLIKCISVKLVVLFSYTLFPTSLLSFLH